jgi:hypothetical protein
VLALPQHPNARFKFASGSTLADANGTLVTNAGLVVGQNMTILGGITAFGRNLVR